jgi:ATP-dependent helicase/nuclease subunit B
MTSFLDQSGPRWFTIPAHRSFVRDLASGLYLALGQGHDPAALSEAIVLTPTRRGARAMSEAFVEAAGGKAVLLPQIRALGDLEAGEPPFEPGDLALDLPPSVSPLRRRFELARLVLDHSDMIGRTLDASSAMDLADALAGFLDSVQIEEVADPSRLDALVEGELAQHWQASARFLKLAVEAWPKRLERLGLSDVATRRVALLRALRQRWLDHPPQGVLVAAGSTGTAPATAELLAVIAKAPQGAVVLPGLDRDLAEAAWRLVGEQHPQGAMKRLLERAGQERRSVQVWPVPTDHNDESRGQWRRRLINEALRPAEATADWLDQIGALREEGAKAGLDPILEGLKGLSLIKARTEEETATAAALLLRETLETEGRTAALVTPDQGLARRVSAKLSRWGIEADSSAGSPLSGSPVGIVIALTVQLAAQLAAAKVDPVRLLALLKMPFVRLGLETEACERARRDLEHLALRGAHPHSWQALETKIAKSAEPDKRPLAKRDPETKPDPKADERRRQRADRAQDLLHRLNTALEKAMAPFTGDEAASLSQAVEALVHAIDQLTDDPSAPSTVWAGATGEAAAALLANLIRESDGLPTVTAKQSAALIERLLADETVRTGGATHPRLRILGAIEARLVRADRLILAGLEEGVWPQAAPTDPFLSRPMRKALGLPPPERRIGLSAHDFAQAACAGEVILLHSERRGGAPAVASRWLWRLETLAKGADQTIPDRPELLDWVRALDAPRQAYSPAPRPNPKPPIAVRPRQMAVTQVELWIRDPYAVYARRILDLKPLQRPNEPIEARARGSAIHDAFETFFDRYGPTLPDQAEGKFEDCLVEALTEAGMPLARMTRERALAKNVAPWVIAFERRRRDGARLVVEQTGELTFAALAGAFTVTAKADRIEVRNHRADVLDFKTGNPPSTKQVLAGLSPQLTLTAAILAGGGFIDVGPALPRQLVYVKVSGARPPGKEFIIIDDKDAEQKTNQALERLKDKVAEYDDPHTGYPSWAMPQFIGKFVGDYDHLARLWEWHVIGGSDEGAAPE